MIGQVPVFVLFHEWMRALPGAVHRNKATVREEHVASYPKRRLFSRSSIAKSDVFP